MSEPENILISVAWPYANAEIHVGNITGSHLPGDIVARYHRLKGNHVLMVSGSFWARWAFMAKSVRGRLSVLFTSGLSAIGVSSHLNTMRHYRTR